MGQQTLPAEPFLTWLETRLESYGPDEAAPAARLAGEIGWQADQSGVRRLHRHLHESDRSAQAKLPKAMVEDALHFAEVGLWEIYPQEEPAEYRDRYCPSCKEIVSVGDDLTCPWCESASESAEGKQRSYCPKCDKSVFASSNDLCWHCGGEVKQKMPWDSCGCSCGQQFARFDQHGRRKKWVRGHAPKAAIEGEVDTEPFSDHLQKLLREINPLEALSSRTGIPSGQLIAILEKRQSKVSRELVIKALWREGRMGQGTGMPARPDAKKIVDLYPQEATITTCPGCGKGKSRHAELCKSCRLKAGRRKQKSSRASALESSGLLEEAWQLHNMKGMPMSEIAHSMLPRAPHKSAGSLAHALTAALRAKGLKTQRGVPIPEQVMSRAKDLRGQGMSVSKIAQELYGSTQHQSVKALRDSLYRREDL